jgi:hypothetical protein
MVNAVGRHRVTPTQVNRPAKNPRPTRPTTRRRPTGNKKSTNPQVSESNPIPEHHPYRALVNGQYTPEKVNAKLWKLAQPVAAEILTADYTRRPDRTHTDAASRRSALSLYLVWLAGTNPELLTTEPLDEDEIRRYLATESRMRRSSHRSHVALRSVLMAFRGTPSPRPARRGEDPIIEPTDDVTFEYALQECATFHNPVTRANTRALLLLTRGAGLDGTDLRWVCGTDIIRIPSAGLWVNVRNPSNPRKIPVLERFARELEDLATARGERPMLAATSSAPITSSTPGEVASVVKRHINRNGNKHHLNVQALRKAWMAEQLAANAPLLTLLAATGLDSLRTFDSLVKQHAPIPSTDPSHIAYELGGLS